MTYTDDMQINLGKMQDYAERFRKAGNNTSAEIYQAQADKLTALIAQYEENQQNAKAFDHIVKLTD